MVIAGANVNVRGHVHQVAGGWCELIEASGAGQRAIGPLRGFDGVDIKMIRPDMIRVSFQHGFEGRDNLFCALGGLAVRRPELPGAQIHGTLRVERGGVEILRVPLAQRAHGVLIEDAELFQVRLGIVGVAGCERFDVAVLRFGSMGGE